MDQWKDTFLSKLTKAQSHWQQRFEQALDEAFVPAFNEHKAFLGDNGFLLSMPLHEPSRRSFKFELAENAYLLMIFRAGAVGEFELRSESFVPGNEPVLRRVVARVADFDQAWATEQLRVALDAFVELLAGAREAVPVGELVEV
jgi:hypothetical protein